MKKSITIRELKKLSQSEKEELKKLSEKELKNGLSSNEQNKKFNLKIRDIFWNCEC